MSFALGVFLFAHAETIEPSCRAGTSGVPHGSVYAPALLPPLNVAGSVRLALLTLRWGGGVIAIKSCWWCAPPPRTAVSVPFVGCASFGQTEKLKAPKGTSRSVRLSHKDAQALAYYKSADGIALLAPRGWYCQGASGSSGSTLYLSPKPIHDSPSGWEGLEGAAIEISRITSENSGRYEVAGIMARAFPEHRTFAAAFWPKSMTSRFRPVPIRTIL